VKPNNSAEPAVFTELYVHGDGIPLYLHLMNVKMLREDCAARNTPLPHAIEAPILDIETVVQSERTRSMLKPFQHVPLTATFNLCFVDLSGIVLPKTMQRYQSTIAERIERLRAAAQRDDLVAEESRCLAWERHKNRVASSEGVVSPGISPTLAAYEIPLEDLPTLELPAAASAVETATSVTASDHGPSDSSLETRQRATKKDDTLGAWGTGSAVDLLKKRAGPPEPCNPSWAGVYKPHHRDPLTLGQGNQRSDQHEEADLAVQQAMSRALREASRPELPQPPAINARKKKTAVGAPARQE
jgi:hypothetical protein